MNSKSYNNVRLKLRFKAWLKGKMVIDATRSSKQRLRSIIQAQKADKYYIRVVYGKGWTKDGFEEICNEGFYSSKEDLLSAFSIFTSKDEIIDYLKNFAVNRVENDR